MALTEETVEDKIEVVGDYRAVQVRTATVIKKDGVEISRSFHRHVKLPHKGCGSWATQTSLANLQKCKLSATLCGQARKDCLSRNDGRRRGVK